MQPITHANKYTVHAWGNRYAGGSILATLTFEHDEIFPVFELLMRLWNTGVLPNALRSKELALERYGFDDGCDHSSTGAQNRGSVRCTTGAGADDEKAQLVVTLFSNIVDSITRRRIFRERCHGGEWIGKRTYDYQFSV
ncbi:hypothetical protein KC324_g11395 [Hortaea werneckii]|nr:hypothetical protein KC324_g11395 [Hortaea werneckii]